MENLTWRPAEISDVAELTGLLNALLQHDGNVDLMSEQNVADELIRLGDLQHNSLLAVTAAGQVVGAGAITPPPQDGRIVHTEGGVHPQWRGRGIGRRIISWYLQRIAELRKEAGADEWDVHLGAADSDESTARLMARNDFRSTRYWFEMERPTAGPIPDVPTAAGLRIVGYEPEHARALHTAHTEAFRDHWGSQPRSFEEWQSMGLQTSAFRPQQSFLAMVADAGEPEVAGYLLSFAWAAADRMWMGTIGVRRPWRRQGVASALMARALEAYREAGVETAGLDVDSVNPTGAVGVYARMGFHSVRRTVTFARTV